MKILFFTLYPDFLPSSRFRVGQYLRFFQADGIAVETRPAIPANLYRVFSGSSRMAAMGRHFSEFLTRGLGLLRSCDHDVIVLQKGIMSFSLKGMEKLLRPLASRLVFDIDDAVYLAPPSRLPHFLSFLEDERQIERVMMQCRLVLAANEELAAAARAFNRDVQVLPTPVDTDYFLPAASALRQEPQGPLRLLWTGNRSSNQHVNFLAPCLTALADNNADVLLTVLSDSPDGIEFNRFPNGRLRYERWSMEAERQALSLSQAGVMPMPDNAWNRAKSGFKAMLAMACGLPVVCSPVGSIRGVLRHGENGLFAESEAEWVEALQRLSGDRALRQTMGDEARKTIVEGFSVAVQYPRLKQMLSAIAREGA